MRIFLLIPFLFMSFSVFAQENSDGQAIKSKVFAKGTQTLGINAILNPNFFFDKPETLPLEILYRKFTKDDQAIRFRVEGRYEKSINENLPFFEEVTNSKLGVGLGYEWHHTLHHRFSWFYGGEAGFTHHWLDEDLARPTTFQGIQMIDFNFSKQRLSEFVIQCFFGTIYELNKRFFLYLQHQVSFNFQNYNSSDSGDLDPIDLSNDDIVGSSGFGNISIKNYGAIVQTKFGIIINI